MPNDCALRSTNFTLGLPSSNNVNRIHADYLISLFEIWLLDNPEHNKEESSKEALLLKKRVSLHVNYFTQIAFKSESNF